MWRAEVKRPDDWRYYFRHSRHCYFLTSHTHEKATNPTLTYPRGIRWLAQGHMTGQGWQAAASAGICAPPVSTGSGYRVLGVEVTQLCLFCSCLFQVLQSSAYSVGHFMEPKRRPLCFIRLNSGHFAACQSHAGYQKPWDLRVGNNNKGELRLYITVLFNPLINCRRWSNFPSSWSYQGQNHNGKGTHRVTSPRLPSLYSDQRDISMLRTRLFPNPLFPFSHSDNSTLTSAPRAGSVWAGLPHYLCFV